MKTSRILVILLIVVAILLIPFIAMQFSNEIYWSLLDFMIMGILLFLTGLAINIVLRKTSSLKQRIILCGVVLAIFILIWAELAVGIFGSPFAGS